MTITPASPIAPTDSAALMAVLVVLGVVHRRRTEAAPRSDLAAS
jgi:hypothetical protein